MVKTQLTLARIAFALVVLGAPLAWAEDSTPGSRDLNVIEEEGFDARFRSMILVPIKLGDRTYPFAIDTGSSHLLFDSSLKSQLGPVRGTRSMGTTIGVSKMETYDAPRAFLGSLSLQTPEWVCCADLTEFRKSTGSEIQGIIGMSFLKNYIVDLDFENRRLKFLRQAKAGPEISRQAITFDEKIKIPYIDLDLPHLGKHPFLVDTGFGNALQIDPSDFEALIKDGELRFDRLMKMTDIAGFHYERYGKLTKVSLKDFYFEDVGVYESASRGDRVGLPLLRGFHCTFDFPAGVLYLGKKAQPTTSPVLP
jgi:predicted aspartyl protease